MTSTGEDGLFLDAVRSVHGALEAPGETSYIDPANVWSLRSLCFEAIPATGGGSQRSYCW